MVVEPGQQQSRASSAIDALAAVSRLLAEGATRDEALGAVVAAAERAAAADVVVARTIDSDRGCLRARAVAASSPALAAELEGSRYGVDELPSAEVEELDEVPEVLRQAADRIGADSVLLIPLGDRAWPIGSLELLRRGPAFDHEERSLARLAADQMRLTLRAASDVDGRQSAAAGLDNLLRVAGDALAAGSDASRTAEQVATLAAEATGARSCLLWRAGPAGSPRVEAVYGLELGEDAAAAANMAAEALAGVERLVVEPFPGGLAAALQLGEPPLGVLQLFFDSSHALRDDVLDRLARFGARAGHALGATERTREQSAELERTRALLTVVGQAIAQLSLAHTLETSIGRLAELLAIDRLAVYLLEPEEERLMAAAGRGLAGPHTRIAERLLELALGPFRGRGLVVISDSVEDRALAPVRDAVSETGIEAAIAAPLVVHEDLVGLVAAYPERGRILSADEEALVTALAAQLAVAVQNARLHEETKRLGTERERALSAERQAAKRLRALFEISRSFAQSLDLQETLDAVVATVVELLEVDVAVIRMLDERGDTLICQAISVADERLAEPVEPLLAQPQPLEKLPGRRLFKMGRPLLLDAETARRLGGAYGLLTPFLEKGSSAAIIPVSTQAEMLGTLSVFSLDPARPLDEETIATALSIAGHSALALDNARLYQQQKRLLDTMQRSLLPRARPDVPGLEVGDVYESSARVDVGGDVYDYLTLDDGRLAVVLGDVTGHGIDAAADMAMAKFVFRSLAREHPEPSDFLAAANEVVVDEVGLSKFITMLYLTVDPEQGELACTSAGHPAPRIVGADGKVQKLPAQGIALGIDSGQEYEEVHARLEPGASVVLYTDGLVEVRLDGELYGERRLDAVLAANATLPAAELAEAIVESCRAFGGGDLDDDCAVVVIKKLA
jgi:serine phosphatase RsbU (regulator of sigma subunit)